VGWCKTSWNPCYKRLGAALETKLRGNSFQVLLSSQFSPLQKGLSEDQWNELLPGLQNLENAAPYVIPLPGYPTPDKGGAGVPQTPPRFFNAAFGGNLAWGVLRISTRPTLNRILLLREYV